MGVGDRWTKWYAFQTGKYQEASLSLVALGLCSSAISGATWGFTYWHEALNLT